MYSCCRYSVTDTDTPMKIILESAYDQLTYMSVHTKFSSETTIYTYNYTRATLTNTYGYPYLLYIIRYRVQIQIKILARVTQVTSLLYCRYGPYWVRGR